MAINIKNGCFQHQCLQVLIYFQAFFASHIPAGFSAQNCMGKEKQQCVFNSQFRPTSELQ